MKKIAILSLLCSLAAPLMPATEAQPINPELQKYITEKLTTEFNKQRAWEQRKKQEIEGWKNLGKFLNTHKYKLLTGAGILGLGYAAWNYGPILEQIITEHPVESSFVYPEIEKRTATKTSNIRCPFYVGKIDRENNTVKLACYDPQYENAEDTSTYIFNHIDLDTGDYSTEKEQEINYDEANSAEEKFYQDYLSIQQQAFQDNLFSTEGVYLSTIKNKVITLARVHLFENIAKFISPLSNNISLVKKYNSLVLKKLGSSSYKICDKGYVPITWHPSENNTFFIAEGYDNQDRCVLFPKTKEADSKNNIKMEQNIVYKIFAQEESTPIIKQKIEVAKDINNVMSARVYSIVATPKGFKKPQLAVLSKALYKRSTSSFHGKDIVESRPPLIEIFDISDPENVQRTNYFIPIAEDNKPITQLEKQGITWLNEDKILIYYKDRCRFYYQIFTTV